jgi:hypothetical protein
MVEDHARAEVALAPAAPRDEPIRLGHSRGASLPPLDLQQLWFSTLRWDWSSLALVPAGSNGSVVRIAKALAQIGNRHGGRPVTRSEGTSLSTSGELAEDISGQFTVNTPSIGSERWKQRTIIALDPVVTDPAGIPVALAADAALLFVELGKTNIAEAQKTVRLIGRDHFRGCILIK